MKQPTAPPSGIPLYPELPITDDGTAGVSTSATSGGNVNVASQQQDQYFRLQEISRLRKHLEDEKDKRSQLYKKYRRGINAVDAVDTALISGRRRRSAGGRGGRCWEPRRGRAGAPDSEYKHPWSPPKLMS